MGRTRIEIDDTLVAEAMARFGLATKAEAVDFAFRRLVGDPLTNDGLLDVRGSGRDGDLDALRGSAG